MLQAQIASCQRQLAALSGWVATLLALRGPCRDSFTDAFPGAVQLRTMEHGNPYA